MGTIREFQKCSQKIRKVSQDFFKSDLKRICPLTCLRSHRKLFVDIRKLGRYTETHIELRARHKKRDPVARIPLFLVTPFSKKERSA